MPRGAGRAGKRSHKGRNRHFTSVEELQEQSRKAEKEKEWRRQQGLPSESESDEEEGATAKKATDLPEGSESESDSDGDVEEKNKGVSHLIEVSNPNRVVNKLKKVSDITEEAPQLSRKEREEIQKQQAAAHYRKLHNEGKTEEARADLARLAIIRKQREEQAKKKAEDQKQKDEKTTAAEQKVLDRRKASKK